MDHVAINTLREHYEHTVRLAETYRDAADEIAHLRDFYHALAMTYERAARKMHIMLESSGSGADEEAA